MVIEGQQRCERSLKVATVCVPLVCASPHGCVLCAFRPAFFSFGIPPPANKQSSGRSSRARCSRRRRRSSRRLRGRCFRRAIRARAANSPWLRPLLRARRSPSVPAGRRNSGLLACRASLARWHVRWHSNNFKNTQEFASDRRMDRRGFRAPPAAAHRLPGNSRRADSTRKYSERRRRTACTSTAPGGGREERLGSGARAVRARLHACLHARARARARRALPLAAFRWPALRSLWLKWCK